MSTDQRPDGPPAWFSSPGEDPIARVSNASRLRVSRVPCPALLPLPLPLSREESARSVRNRRPVTVYVTVTTSRFPGFQTSPCTSTTKCPGSALDTRSRPVIVCCSAAVLPAQLAYDSARLARPMGTRLHKRAITSLPSPVCYFWETELHLLKSTDQKTCCSLSLGSRSLRSHESLPSSQFPIPRTCPL